MLVLMEDSSLPDICKRGNMMGCEQSGRFLEGDKDKFLIQILIGPTRGDTQLDLLLTGKKVLIGDVTINGSLGCSNH